MGHRFIDGNTSMAGRIHEGDLEAYTLIAIYVPAISQQAIQDQNCHCAAVMLL